MIDHMIIWASAAAAAGALTFLVRYPMRTHGAWRSHPWGVHVMFFTVALLLLELQPLAYRLFGDWPWREPVLGVLMILLAVAHWHRVVLNERDLQPRRKDPTMTDATTPTTPGTPVRPLRHGRPRPVLWFGALIVALNAIATAGDAANIVPPTVYRWVVLASIVAAAVGAFLVQGAVTPLADPRNSAGQQLLPISALFGPVRSAARAGTAAAIADQAAAVDAIDLQAPRVPRDGRPPVG